ncbi:MAG: RHS repeat-associated core domain-containing protein [Anaerolineae bacterium]|nr:RHS repeat-associated core domain-containing protein [Anaerolineae bacterium]
MSKYYTFNGQRVALRQGDVVYYLHGDHPSALLRTGLGSTSLTTAGTGAVVSEARYLPYGRERCADGAAVTDFGFTSQRKEGFGLYDYNARYYSPYLGRFISADTIVPRPNNPQSLNRYSYVLNRPLQGGDPTGHSGPINDFLQGFAYELVTNNYDAALLSSEFSYRQKAEALAVDNQDNVAFQSGRLAGGVASAVEGALEIGASVPMIGGGGLEAGATSETVASRMG